MLGGECLGSPVCHDRAGGGEQPGDEHLGEARHHDGDRGHHAPHLLVTLHHALHLPARDPRRGLPAFLRHLKHRGVTISTFPSETEAEFEFK